jgi:hypothetical protein
METLAAALAAARSAAEGQRLLAESLRAMTGALAVSVSQFDPQAGKLRVGHVAAAAEVLESARRVLGQPLQSLDLRPGASLAMILHGPWAVEFGGLREVFFGQVPQQLVQDLELALNLGRAYGLALRHGEELLGAATVFMSRGGGGPGIADLASWARTLSEALWRQRAR